MDGVNAARYSPAGPSHEPTTSAMDQLNTQTDYEFEGFRLDTVLQVLVCPNGTPVALPARAFDALRFLVERAGELVDKRSLMRALWPSTVVEENNLNQCILAIRKALGETAGERRFILTVPGRGFKFVAPVRAVCAPRAGSASNAPNAPAAGLPPRPDVPNVRELESPTRSRYLIASLAVLAVAAVATAGLLYSFRARPVTSPAEYEALTDVGGSATAPALSPDGRMLAFIEGGTAFLSTGQIYLKLLPDGQPVRLTSLSGPIYAPTFAPDGTRVAYTLVQKREDLLTWDTWTVPITGGEPTLLLGNAAGLGWIGPHELLYSEIRNGLHMGVVTSDDGRGGQRALYFPKHERAMAHYSYLSPDRRSVLLVEMDRAGEWQRCRLIPFSGGSAGTPVGPAGHCLSAAWSPDGKWMYFSADVGGHSHLWRQRVGNSDAEQITFGPTEEQGVAVSPDGHSLVTSLGLQQQSIWIHDANGERRLTTETVASSPWFSADARHLYFLTAQGAANSSDLWRLDLQRGQKEPLLPGFAVMDYDISRDEREVAFAIDRDGEKQLWIAPTDRHAAPKLLMHGADAPRFDNAGHIFFRLLGDKANYLYRAQDDGSSKQRVVDAPILDFLNVSPTGKWVAVHMVIDGNGATSIRGTGNESFRWSRNGWWPVRWSGDGRMLYLEAGPPSNNSFTHGRTLPIALSSDDAAPVIPELPVTQDEGLLPHTTQGFFPGPDRETYVFTRTERRQNVFRIPLH